MCFPNHSWYMHLFVKSSISWWWLCLMSLTKRVRLWQWINWSGCWERDEVRGLHTPVLLRHFSLWRWLSGFLPTVTLAPNIDISNTNLSPTRCQGQRFKAPLWDGIAFHSVSTCSGGEDLRSFVFNIMFFHSSNPVNFRFNSYHPNKRPIFNYFFLAALSPSQGRHLYKLKRWYTELWKVIRFARKQRLKK